MKWYGKKHAEYTVSAIAPCPLPLSQPSPSPFPLNHSQFCLVTIDGLLWLWPSATASAVSLELAVEPQLSLVFPCFPGLGTHPQTGHADHGPWQPMLPW